MIENEGWHCPTCGYHAMDVSAIWGHMGAKHKKALKPIKHGTTAGYAAEKRRGLPTCPSCRKAWATYYRHQRGNPVFRPFKDILKKAKGK